MLFRFLADALVVIHLGFVLFVLFGGFLALRRRGWAWVHLPAALWGALIEFGSWVCPLTPLENRFRILGGEEGYPGGFVEEYLIPLLYPGGLTRTHQLWLGAVVVLVNLGIYGWVLRRRADRTNQTG
jgi:hypothetical protein